MLSHALDGEQGGSCGALTNGQQGPVLGRVVKRLEPRHIGKLDNHQPVHGSIAFQPFHRTAARQIPPAVRRDDRGNCFAIFLIRRGVGDLDTGKNVGRHDFGSELYLYKEYRQYGTIAKSDPKRT